METSELNANEIEEYLKNLTVSMVLEGRIKKGIQLTLSNCLQRLAIEFWNMEKS